MSKFVITIVKSVDDNHMVDVHEIEILNIERIQERLVEKLKEITNELFITNSIHIEYHAN